MDRFALRLFTLLALCLCAPPVKAQEAGEPYPPCNRTPTENDVDAAKGAYRAGQVSFQEADYERALLYWNDAYRRDCTAVRLLLNIARAFELSSNRQGALVALTTYLERDPSSKVRVSVEKRIAKLRVQIAEEEAAREAAQLRNSPPQQPAPLAEPDEPSPPPKPTAVRVSPPMVLTLSGSTVAVAGGVLAVVGAVGVSKEKNRIADQTGCERKGLNWTCPSEAQRADAQALSEQSQTIKNSRLLRTVGIVSLSAGAVSAAVGAVLIVQSKKKQYAQRANLRWALQAVPTWRPGYGGLDLRGVF